MVFESLHLSISIEKSPSEVYLFASDPAHLPHWAAGLSQSKIEQVLDKWFAESPMGRVQIQFAPYNEFGILDHDVILADGTRFYNPMRVFRNGRGSEVVFTLFRQTGMTDAAFAEDAAQVRADLAKLKALLERPA